MHSKTIWQILSIVAGYWICCCQSVDDFNGILHHYETLHHRDLIHRMKRSADGRTAGEKLVEFTALGRHFKLKLQRHAQILSPDFRVVSVGRDNQEKEVMMETNIIYHGVDINAPSSEVQAYWEDDSMVATIHTPNDVYVVEPSWRHFPDPSNYSMIVYKHSDLKLGKDLGKQYSWHVNPNIDDAAAYDTVDHSGERLYKETETSHLKSKRVKRRTLPTKTRCPLLLVADYRFFEHMGQKSHTKTTHYLIALIDRVNTLYQGTDFGNGYIGMGFEIKEVRIHEVPTVVHSSRLHYNEERDRWDTKSLLEAFSVNNMDAGKHCLAHLFTAQPFHGFRLGLSYLASYIPSNPGGICSQVYYKGGYQLFLNTGFSTALNRYNRRLLTSEADLITAHGFGHSWGSDHDPDTAECSKGSSDGGKYIMSSYHVAGYELNNKKFSPCSKRSIQAVLDSKHEKCFTAPQAAFCGNSILESGEECDGGHEAKSGTDPCCDTNCSLKPNAQCSDINHSCCDSCQFAGAGVKCSGGGFCEDSSYCTGDSRECPEPTPKPDGEECFNKGKCFNGVCLPFCETVGLVTCTCDDTDNMNGTCKYCCMSTGSNTACTPYAFPDGVYEKLPNGMPCAHGYCEEGKCENQVQDLVPRFWTISPTDAANTTTADHSEGAGDDATTAVQTGGQSVPTWSAGFFCVMVLMLPMWKM